MMRPELPRHLQADLNRWLEHSGEAYRAGDTARSRHLAEAAWNSIPTPKADWDFFPEIIVRHMIALAVADKDRPALQNWIDELYVVHRDTGRTQAFTLTTEAEALRSMGFDAEADAVLSRMNTVSSDPTGSAADLATGLDEAANNLDDAVHEQITALSEDGDDLVDADDFAEARKRYDQAIALLPAPPDHWSAWTWLQVAIGDSYFFEKDWIACREAFRNAVRGPEGLGNPFIHLRLGQCAFELNDEISAMEELMRAYLGGGPEIFDDDPEYLSFLKANVDLTSQAG